MKKYGSHHKGNPECIKGGFKCGEQVAASSNDLADGAANQTAVVEKLTATVAGVSEQVEQNSESAKKISGRVDERRCNLESNGKMQEMVASMHEINKLYDKF